MYFCFGIEFEKIHNILKINFLYLWLLMLISFESISQQQQDSSSTSKGKFFSLKQGLMTNQAKKFEGVITSYIIIDGDTVPTVNLPSIMVLDKKVFKNARDERKWRKLVRDVKKAYPYAKIAGVKLRECEAKLALPENAGRKKELMKEVERQIKDEFESDIRKLTWTQGIILLKLIDRETSHSSYELIRDLRGKFAAFFWQSLASIFDVSLKTEYDPTNEDRNIEEIVLKLERGEI